MKENKFFFYSFVNTQVREHKPISRSLSWAFPCLVRKTSGPASSLAELYRPCKACSLILCSPQVSIPQQCSVFCGYVEWNVLRAEPSKTRRTLKMNASSIAALCGTNRWPWEAARADFRLQSKPKNRWGSSRRRSLGSLSAQLSEKRTLEENTELTKSVIYNPSFP